MLPPSSFIAFLILSILAIAATAYIIYFLVKKTSHEVRTAFLLTLTVCLASWLVFQSITLRIVITAFCISVVWMVKEIKDSPIEKEDNMTDEHYGGQDIFS